MTFHHYRLTKLLRIFEVFIKKHKPLKPEDHKKDYSDLEIEQEYEKVYYRVYAVYLILFCMVSWICFFAVGLLYDNNIFGIYSSFFMALILTVFSMRVHLGAVSMLTSFVSPHLSQKYMESLNSNKG